MREQIEQHKTLVAVVVAVLVTAAVTYFMARSVIKVRGEGGVDALVFKSDLVTLKVPITEILTAESEKYKGSWFVRGWANLGVDMKGVYCEKPDAKGQVKFTIPEAKVLDVSLDFEKSMIWDIKRVVWYPNPFINDEYLNLRDEWQKQAQILVRKAAENPKLKEIAQQQARQVVTEQIMQLGLVPVDAPPPPEVP